MSHTKLKAPPGASSASVDGVEYPVAEDGTVEVPPEIVGHLYQFGFTNLPAAIAAPGEADPADPQGDVDAPKATPAPKASATPAKPKR